MWCSGTCPLIAGVLIGAAPPVEEDVEELVGEDPFCGETVRFGIAYEEATLNWFDSLPFREEPMTD